MDDAPSFKNFFSDKFILTSIGLFILWYLLALMKYINLRDVSEYGFVLIAIIFVIPYLIGSTIIFYIYNVSKKILRSIFIAIPLFFILLVLNFIFQITLYNSVYGNRGEFDGIQFMYFNIFSLVIVYIVSLISLLIYHFIIRKKITVL